MEQDEGEDSSKEPTQTSAVAASMCAHRPGISQPWEILVHCIFLWTAESSMRTTAVSAQQGSKTSQARRLFLSLEFACTLQMIMLAAKDGLAAKQEARQTSRGRTICQLLRRGANNHNLTITVGATVRCELGNTYVGQTNFLFQHRQTISINVRDQPPKNSTIRRDVVITASS